MADTSRHLAAVIAARYDGDEAEARQLHDSTLRRIAWRARRGCKTCSACGEDKKPAAFGTDSTKPDGLAGRCLSCEAERSRSRRAV